MGSTSSKRDLIYQIVKLLEKQGTAVKERTIEDFLKNIAAPIFDRLGFEHF